MVGPVSAEQVGKIVVEGKAIVPITSTEYQVADNLSKLDAEARLQVGSQRKVDWAIQHKVNDEQIGLRDKKGAKVRPSGSDEEKRYKKAEHVVDIAEEYHEKGYEKMTGNQTELLKMAVEVATANPVIQKYLETLQMGTARDTVAQKLAENLLKDPNVRDRVVALLLEKGNLSGLIADEASKLEIEITALEGEKVKLEAEKTSVQAEIDAFEKELKRFDTTVSAPGDYAIEAVKLAGEISSGQQKINDYDSEISESKDVIDDLRSSMTSAKTQPERDALKQQLKDARRDIRDNQTEKTKVEGEVTVKAAQLKAFESQKKQTEDKLEEKKKYMKDKIDDVITKTVKDIDEKNPQLAKIKSERSLKEDQYVVGLDEIFRRAISEKLTTQIQEATKGTKDILDKEATSETDQIKKRVREHISRRWFDIALNFDKNTINSDYGDLLAEATDVDVGPASAPKTLFLNGPDRVLLKVLQGSNISEENQLKLMQDKDFLTEFSPKVAEKTITMKMLTGGIGLKDINTIAHSDWGPQMVAKAIQGKESVKKQIDEAFGAGAIDWKGNVELQFKKMFEGVGKFTSHNAIWIILAILAGLGLMIAIKH